MLAGPELLSHFDLRQAMATLSYDLKPGAEKAALYTWQRFWMAVNFLQFLPVFYAYTPQSKHDGTAAGLLWPVPSALMPASPSGKAPLATVAASSAAAASSPAAEAGAGAHVPVAGLEPAWYGQLDEALAEALRAQKIDWPEEPEVGVDVLDASEAAIGVAELLFPESRVAFLLEEEPDQLAARPHLEAQGWQVCTSAEALLQVFAGTGSS